MSQRGKTAGSKMCLKTPFVSDADLASRHSSLALTASSGGWKWRSET